MGAGCGSGLLSAAESGDEATAACCSCPAGSGRLDPAAASGRESALESACACSAFILHVFEQLWNHHSRAMTCKRGALLCSLVCNVDASQVDQS